MIRRLSLLAAPLLVWTVAAQPASAGVVVCQSGAIDFGGHEQPLLAFAWEGEPKPLERGIMFETLLDRSEGDRTLAVVTSADSCSRWKAVGGEQKKLRLRFEAAEGDALVLGDGNAVVGKVRCESSGTYVELRVDEYYKIGMSY